MLPLLRKAALIDPPEGDRCLGEHRSSNASQNDTRDQQIAESVSRLQRDGRDADLPPRLSPAESSRQTAGVGGYATRPRSPRTPQEKIEGGDSGKLDYRWQLGYDPLRMMRLLFTLLPLLGIATASGQPAVESEGPASHPHILTMTVDGTINPIVAEYIEQGMERAENENFDAVVIQIDTPGGLDTAMRQIIKAIEESAVPVIVYVSPRGARAASAGVFITLTAHIAAMAPGTNIGAAHPVAMGEKEMDETMSAKVENDAAAYIRGIAENHGRNADWAEKAVRESVSITAKEALELHVIDYVAPSLDALLQEIDQKEISVRGKKVTLSTKNYEAVSHEMGLRHRILDTISNPNVAYILMMIGMWGIFFELSNPGSIFPGVIGGISLILAFVAFQTLPINYAGFMLILLALILFIAEIKITSYGFLTIGGILSLALGSLMLFDSGIPGFSLSWKIVVMVIGATAGVIVTGISLAVAAQRRKVRTGAAGLIGEKGTVKQELNPKGKVFLHGELWNATSSEPLSEGTPIEVTGVEGMTLRVRKSE